jgi:enamine deaminase RidA (YjgF/YER057c/UK114 family)
MSPNISAQGSYQLAVTIGDIVYTAGMTPRSDGQLAWRGKVGSALSVEQALEATTLATTNALAVASQAVPAGKVLSRCLLLHIYVNAVDDFEQHARVADAASRVVIDALGAEAMGARVAIGVASLPGGSPVEVQFTGLLRIETTP